MVAVIMKKDASLFKAVSHKLNSILLILGFGGGGYRPMNYEMVFFFFFVALHFICAADGCK